MTNRRREAGSAAPRGAAGAWCGRRERATTLIHADMPVWIELSASPLAASIVVSFTG
jgi:hypothetical protein